MLLCGLLNFYLKNVFPHVCVVGAGAHICIYELSEREQTSAFVVFGAHVVSACGDENSDCGSSI